MMYASKVIQGPCKGCTDRHSIKNDKGEIIAFCHRDCIKYKEYKAKKNDVYKNNNEMNSERATLNQQRYAVSLMKKNKVGIK